MCFHMTKSYARNNLSQEQYEELVSAVVDAAEKDQFVAVRGIAHEDWSGTNLEYQVAVSDEYIKSQWYCEEATQWLLEELPE